MSFGKLLKFLFPEYQILNAAQRYGLITKRRQQPLSPESSQAANHSQDQTPQGVNISSNKTLCNTGQCNTSSNPIASWQNSTEPYNNQSTVKLGSLEINQKFDRVSGNLASQIIGQKQCLANLLIAFKRSFISGYSDVKPRNTLFLLGNKSSGRHTMITLMVKALAQQALIANDAISRLDLALYTGNGDELLFIKDLNIALTNLSDAIIFDNVEKCPSSYLGVIHQLVTTGQYRYADTSSNSLMLSSASKYFVFISAINESKVIEIFGNKFIQSVGDIVTVDEYTIDDLTLLTQLFLSDLSYRCLYHLHIELKYDTDVVNYCANQYQTKLGVISIKDYLNNFIYNALVEVRLKNNLVANQNIYLQCLNGSLVMKEDTNDAVPINLKDLLPQKYNSHLDDIKYELDAIVGLASVKEHILDLENNYNIQKRRENAGYKSNSISMHMIFTGNPGTGKTMMARVVAKYLKAIGVLMGGQVREVSRADLVGRYVGHTAKLTNEVIQSALGGVLFIDEAYSLCRDKNDTFGLEAVDALVKGIEDYRDNLLVILAGYSDEMKDFLQSNSGLKSRFPNVINFEDYSPQEMLQIAQITAKAKGYAIEDACHEPFIRLVEKSQIKGRNDSGNGRLVRNVIESAILEQSKRLNIQPAADMGLLTQADFKFTEQNTFDLEASLAPIIGLEEVKQTIRTQYTLLLADKKRREANIIVDMTQTLNIIFTGNPGTGKTTIARVMAAMFRDMGLLKQGQLIETDRSGLVAEYVGQTASKTEQLFKSALGGVLFIDEAYSLVNSNPYDKEAIDILVKLIEDYRGEIVVILAGYKKEMSDFVKGNSGLESRFPLNIDFPDYSAEELYKIALLMIANKGFNLTEEAQQVLQQHIVAIQKTASSYSGNARMVRNMIEKVLRNQSARIATTETTSDELILILPNDIRPEVATKNDYDLDAALNSIIGLNEVKTYIRSLYALLRVQAERKKMGLAIDNSQTLHMIFKGNPGTGKTMMARIIAEVLYHIKVINSNKMVETDRAGLVAGYVGQTALKTTEKIMEALDGVLFIDEAYSLSQAGANDYGRETIDTLVKLMDDNRQRLVVILAGYNQNMDDFLQVNPGLKSRFPNIIEFADYSVDELMQIADGLYQSRGYQLNDAAHQKLYGLFTEAVQEESFGNGRYVRNVFEKSLNQQALRLSTDSDLTREELITIVADDIIKS